MDPLNLPVPVSSEDYVPPEDVLFEQVWDPSVVVPSPKGVGAPRELAELVIEFAGVVSHDKVRETLACFNRGRGDVCCGTRCISGLQGCDSARGGGVSTSLPTWGDEGNSVRKRRWWRLAGLGGSMKKEALFHI